MSDKLNNKVSRREMIHTGMACLSGLGFALAASSLASCRTSPGQNPAEPPPNILLIVADDAG